MKSSVREIKIKLPEDVLLSASISEKQLVQEMREMIAFKLFADGRLSGGTAAKLAGMPRLNFLFKAGQQKWILLLYEQGISDSQVVFHIGGDRHRQRDQAIFFKLGFLNIKRFFLRPIMIAF